MATDTAFIVSYRCPRCQATLEAGPKQADSWLRCPKCGRPSLPPAFTRAFVPPPAVEGDVIYIGDFDRLNAIPPALPSSSAAGSAWRMLFLAGLLICAALLIFSLLDQDVIKASIFGLGALVCLGFLVVPRRRI